MPKKEQTKNQNNSVAAILNSDDICKQIRSNKSQT